MFRTLTTAAVLALTVTAAQAGDTAVRFGDLNPARQADAELLAARVQTAAQTACSAAWSADGQASLFYKQIADSCAYRLSRSTMAQIETIMEQRGKVASN